MSNKHSTPTVAELQRRINQLESKLALAIEQRDQAQETAVLMRQGIIVRNQCLFLRWGEYLDSDSIAAVKRGDMTLQQAVERRNQRHPLLAYNRGPGLALSAAYEMAL